MNEEKTSFLSDGLKLDASIYRPETSDASLPLVVTCSGFQGLNAIHPARFARALTPRGYTCFGFDYRGFAPSEGESGRVHLDEQVRDIANALRFVRTKIAPRKIALMGWGMGAGLVLEAARVAVGIDALVVMNGLYDAIRVQRALRGEDGWREFRAWLDAERARLVAGGAPRKVDPFDIYPLDTETKRYCDDVLRKHDEFGHGVWPSFADSLLQLRADTSLDHLRATPILVVHGERNALHPPEEARSLLERYPGPKEAYWVPDANHTEWMKDDHPKFVALANEIDRFVRARLGSG
jgi:pimeloyl-ACP methyl ester carboxylesterase